MSDRSFAVSPWKGYALAAIAAASWATGGVAAKWLFSPADATSAAWPFPPPGLTVAPTTLAGARALMSFVLLAAYLLVVSRSSLRVPPRGLPFLALFGVAALAGVHVTYYQAITYTNVATAILLEYLAPVIVLVFSVLFLSEKLTWTLPIGVLLSITGCALVVGAIGGSLAVSSAGIAWGLASAGFFAFYQLLGKWASTRYTPWTLLCYGLGFASVFWLIYLGGPGSMVALLGKPVGMLAVLYLALVGTIIPFAASLKALHYIDATKSVVTSTLEPVIAGAIAWAMLRERFDALQLLGGALVIAAILLVQRLPQIAEEELPPVP